MRIGLDFGGVIEPSTKDWSRLVAKLLRSGYEVFVVSHAIAEWDFQKRVDFCEDSGAINLTFIMPPNEPAVQRKKLDVLKQHQIELYIDDYPDRCRFIMENLPDCLCLYSPESKWEITLELISGLVDEG